MDENLSDALGEVIDKWCGIEAGSYGMGTQLSNLWRRSFPTDPPYDPVGIDSLVGKVKKAPFFKDCSRARGLTHGQFITGGGLRTVGDLHDHLRPCEPTA